uniref:Thioesterase domain-containing protein n=1 Tax=Acrobeloides nanus TaxID=290746 RepID=A0A914C2T5_9BILA
MSTLINNGLDDLHISEKVDYLSLLEGSIKKLQDDSSFNRVASKAKAISATPKSVVVELEIGEEHVNGNSTIHGGQIAALQDIICAHAVGREVSYIYSILYLERF